MVIKNVSLKMPCLNLETRKQVIVLLKAGYSIREIHGRLEDEGVMFTLHKNSHFVLHFINKMYCQSHDTHYRQDDWMA